MKSLKNKLTRLAPRALDAHKGDFGRILLVGGRLGFTGAISLASKSAVCAGAGLVTAAIPLRCIDIVAGFDPCYMTLPIKSTASGSFHRDSLTELAKHLGLFNILAVGPGLGRDKTAQVLTTYCYKNFAGPAVFDADALFALSIKQSHLASHKGPRILTPHAGEFERLSGVSAANRDKQISAALAYAKKNDLTIVLKGPNTLVTDGSKKFFCETGNPGMASGGTGDCLTGIISALVGQGLSPYDAACLGATVHGLAGDLAISQSKGPSVTPLQLIANLAVAFSMLA